MNTKAKATDYKLDYAKVKKAHKNLNALLRRRRLMKLVMTKGPMTVSGVMINLRLKEHCEASRYVSELYNAGYLAKQKDGKEVIVYMTEKVMNNMDAVNRFIESGKK